MGLGSSIYTKSFNRSSPCFLVFNNDKRGEVFLSIRESARFYFIFLLFEEEADVGEVDDKKGSASPTKRFLYYTEIATSAPILS